MNPTYHSTPTPTPPRRFVAKGHDAQLEKAQKEGREVFITMMDGSEDIVGVITRRDKWTLTIREFEATHQVIVYKHAISTIVIKDPVVSGGE